MLNIKIKPNGTLLWKTKDEQRIIEKLLDNGEESMTEGEMLFLSFVKHGGEYNRNLERSMEDAYKQI